MATNQHKRLPSVIITTDRASLVALKKLNDYAPVNPALRIETLSALEARLRQTEEAEILAIKALDAARDARTTAGWDLHNAMLDVKAAVIGQYGANSDAVQSLGLKKKVDYRRPARRRTTTVS